MSRKIDVRPDRGPDSYTVGPIKCSAEFAEKIDKWKEEARNQQIRWVDRDLYNPKMVGYRGFCSMLCMLFRMNRDAKKRGFKARYTVDVPMRWFK